MKRYVRGATTSTALLSAALVLVTACSGTGDGGDEPSRAPQLRAVPSPAATGPAGLAAKALNSGSVTGTTVTTPKDTTRAADIETDRECQPLARALTGTALAAPEDTAVRRVTGDGLVTTVTLASYKREKAATDALAKLSTAADSCARGFTMKAAGKEYQVTEAVRELAPQGADQAMGLAVTLRTAGKNSTRKVIALRRGPTISLFTTTAGRTPPPKDLAVPPTVVNTQLAALS